MPSLKLTPEQVREAMRNPKRGARIRQSEPGRRTYRLRTYDSIAEMEFAKQLDVSKAAGLIKDWVPQVGIPLCVNGYKICEIVVDFMTLPISQNTEENQLFEIKGHSTEVYQMKRKLLAAIRPELNYTVLYVDGDKLLTEAEYKQRRKDRSARRKARKKLLKNAGH